MSKKKSCNLKRIPSLPLSFFLPSASSLLYKSKVRTEMVPKSFMKWALHLHFNGACCALKFLLMAEGNNSTITVLCFLPHLVFGLNVGQMNYRSHGRLKEMVLVSFLLYSYGLWDLEVSSHGGKWPSKCGQGQHCQVAQGPSCVPKLPQRVSTSAPVKAWPSSLDDYLLECPQSTGVLSWLENMRGIWHEVPYGHVSISPATDKQILWHQVCSFLLLSPLAICHLHKSSPLTTRQRTYKHYSVSPNPPSCTVSSIP